MVGEGKHFGLSTACLNVTLGGEVAETGVMEIPRGEYQTDITVRDLIKCYSETTCLVILVTNSLFWIV